MKKAFLFIALFFLFLSAVHAKVWTECPPAGTITESVTLQGVTECDRDYTLSVLEGQELIFDCGGAEMHGGFTVLAKNGKVDLRNCHLNKVNNIGPAIIRATAFSKGIITISHNSFKSKSKAWRGMEVDSRKGGKITISNNFFDCYKGISRAYSIDENSVITILDNNFEGKGFGIDNASAIAGGRIDIVGNGFRNNVEGIHNISTQQKGKSTFVVSNNLFENNNNGIYGCYVANGEGIISENVFRGNGHYGIANVGVDVNSSLIITKNKFEENGYGVGLGQKIFNITISKNEFKNTVGVIGTYGPFYRSELRIQENTFEGGRYGLGLSLGGHILIANNKFIKNNDSGINLSLVWGHLEIYDNSFERDNKGVVLRNNGSAVFSKNSFSDGNEGVWLDSYGGIVFVSENIFKRNRTDTGIKIEEGSNPIVISKNSFSKSELVVLVEYDKKHSLIVGDGYGEVVSISTKEELEQAINHEQAKYHNFKVCISSNEFFNVGTIIKAPKYSFGNYSGECFSCGVCPLEDCNSCLARCLGEFEENHPPHADFVAVPREGFVPLTVDFDALMSSDPDGDALSFFWVFSDRAETMSVPVFPLVFDSLEPIDVTLTVKDAGGLSDSVTKTVFMLVVCLILLLRLFFLIVKRLLLL